MNDHAATRPPAVNPFTRVRWFSPWRLMVSAIGGVALSCMFGAMLWRGYLYGNTDAEIHAALRQADLLVARVDGGTVSWSEIESLGWNLTYWNRRKVQLRALEQVSGTPPFPLNWVWENRANIRQVDWDKPDTDAFSKTLSLAPASLIISVPIAWLTLSIITVVMVICGASISGIWYFALRRLTEMAQAVRGTSPDGVKNRTSDKHTDNDRHSK